LFGRAKKARRAVIDLHNHILHGLDDGAADLSESVRIAQQFVSEGVTTVAATPHLNPERGTGPTVHEVRQKVEELREVLATSTVDLTIVTGNELYLVPQAVDLLEAGSVCALGDSHYVLVEVSLLARERPLFLEDTVFRLQLAGYAVILAHPERHPFVLRDLHSLDGLLERGVNLQVTAPTLLGQYGAQVRRAAEALLRAGSYVLAASDRHHPGPDRSLSVLHRRIAELTDTGTADLLLRENPARVLADKGLEKPAPVLYQPSLFDRLLRRS
jgi:protein-tyrosine phosphatase